MSSKDEMVGIVDENERSTSELEVDERITMGDYIRSVPRGRPKSGRVWKDPRPPSLSKIAKPKTLRTNWKKKVEQKLIKQSVKQLENELLEDKRQKIEDLKRRQKSNKERKLLNERKSEIVQKITNLKKLKTTKKKHLRNIEKR